MVFEEEVFSSEARSPDTVVVGSPSQVPFTSRGILWVVFGLVFQFLSLEGPLCVRGLVFCCRPVEKRFFHLLPKNFKHTNIIPLST